jgi:hypothetical protein
MKTVHSFVAQQPSGVHEVQDALADAVTLAGEGLLGRHPSGWRL